MYGTHSTDGGAVLQEANTDRCPGIDEHPIIASLICGIFSMALGICTRIVYHTYSRERFFRTWIANDLEFTSDIT